MPWFLFQTPDCASQMTKLLNPRPPYIVMLEMTKIDKSASMRAHTHTGVTAACYGVWILCGF